MTIFKMEDLEDIPRVMVPMPETKSVFGGRHYRGITVEKIKESVASLYGVTVANINGRARASHLVRPRQIAVWMAAKLTPCSYKELGAWFFRDHTTVLHSIRKIDDLRDRDERFADMTDALLERLGG